MPIATVSFFIHCRFRISRFAAVILLAALYTLVPGNPAEAQCIGTVLDVTGTEYRENDWFDLPNGAQLDAVEDRFIAQTLIQDETRSKYPLDIRSANSTACWHGGLVEFTDNLNSTWAERKAHNSAGLISSETEILIEGIRIHNAHDGIRPAWSKTGVATVDFAIRGAWLSYIRDDCVENDWHAGGLIDDSLFDGCYVFASATGGSEKSPNLVSIRNSLIYLQKMPGPNGWDDPAIKGHGEIFKWSSFAPDVEIHDSIFLIEGYAVTDWNPDGQPDHSANALAFKNIRQCSNVTIVWDGPGEFPGYVPFCVTVTKDRTVWERARADWIANHPEVMRVQGDPAPAKLLVPTEDTGQSGSEPVESDGSGEGTLSGEGGTGAIVDDSALSGDATGGSTSSGGSSGQTIDGQTQLDDSSDTGTTDSLAYTTEDVYPPTVDIISPVSGMKVFVSSTVWVEVDVADNAGVARLEVYMDNETPYVFEGGGTHSFTWEPKSSKKRHKVRAVAYDFSGNKASDQVFIDSIR